MTLSDKVAQEFKDLAKKGRGVVIKDLVFNIVKELITLGGDLDEKKIW